MKNILSLDDIVDFLLDSKRQAEILYDLLDEKTKNSLRPGNYAAYFDSSLELYSFFKILDPPIPEFENLPKYLCYVTEYSVNCTQGENKVIQSASLTPITKAQFRLFENNNWKV